MVTGDSTGDSTSLVAGTTARCFTTSIRTVRTPELVLFRTSAFAKDSCPSCFFRICQKTIRLGGKFRRCKNYQNGFFKMLFFFPTKINKRTNQPWRKICFFRCLRSALSGPSIREQRGDVSRCTKNPTIR